MNQQLSNLRLKSSSSTSESVEFSLASSAHLRMYPFQLGGDNRCTPEDACMNSRDPDSPFGTHSSFYEPDVGRVVNTQMTPPSAGL